VCSMALHSVELLTLSDFTLKLSKHLSLT